MADTENETFDLLVIGAGTGGASVARAAAAAGWRVAITDALPYGGTCALRGCDPKKMMVAVAEAVERAASLSGKGIAGPAPGVDWAAMRGFLHSFTDRMPGAIEKGLAGAGITTLHERARFIAPGRLQLGGREIRAGKVHIATGARPMTLGIPGEEHLTTSTEFLDLPQRPESVVFVGGGFIAMEFAHIARRAGVPRVTVLQRGARVLPQFDPDLVGLLTEHSRALGIDIRCGAEVSAITRAGGGLRVEYETGQGAEGIDCALAVHAAGRVPNIEGLNLEAAGIEAGKRGILVSEYMRSQSNPDVFAAGDCADSGPNLTPVSALEARIAGKNLLAGKDARAIAYPPIPSTVFTLPPLAALGLSEAEAQAQGLEFEVKYQKTDSWYSTRRLGGTLSAFKTLVEPGGGGILGAHLLGPGAEEQINILATAMGAGLTANRLKAQIFAYPSFASDIGSMI